mgnify:CR=1 FL=1
MLASIHRGIESALELDHTPSLADRDTILACCRSPAKFRENEVRALIDGKKRSGNQG